jgi:hypothetical protein
MVLAISFRRTVDKLLSLQSAHRLIVLFSRTRSSLSSLIRQTGSACVEDESGIGSREANMRICIIMLDHSRPFVLSPTIGAERLHDRPGCHLNSPSSWKGCPHLAWSGNVHESCEYLNTSEGVRVDVQGHQIASRWCSSVQCCRHWAHDGVCGCSPQHH